MPEQYGFGDYATEPTRLCQSNKGGDQMNQKDDEVAHCGNDIKTRQALDFGPLLEFAMNRAQRRYQRTQRTRRSAYQRTVLAFSPTSLQPSGSGQRRLQHIRKK